MPAATAASKSTMRYLVVATDYDGTLASSGRVDDATIEVLRRIVASGRKLILVTGRKLDDLLNVFPHADLFTRIVAENGALLYNPSNKEEQLLCDGPNQGLLSRLRERGIPVDSGKAIVATWEPHETTVVETIKELGLELQVIFNKGAVMVLPSGINKGTGLNCALKELSISRHNVVGIGDAENDHAFLSSCECAVAVANALPTLKERADIVSKADHGAGVVEILEQLLADDLQKYDAKLSRHRVLLGHAGDDEVYIIPQRGSILIAGPSGSGKSSAVSGLIERLSRQNYQYCVIDPEGDYDQFLDAITIGTVDHPPDVEQAMALLEKPEHDVVFNLLGTKLEDRPIAFANLFARITSLRARSAHPHWLVVDEAHHLLPSSWTPAQSTTPTELGSTVLVTVHPESVSPAALQPVEIVIAVGKSARQTIESFCQVLGEAPPEIRDGDPASGSALVWFRISDRSPLLVELAPAEAERKRHSRKYAVGELPPESSFYFTGPEGKLHLRAYNLLSFANIAEGIDDETLLFHLRRGDYSRWFRDMVKDKDLAKEAETLEKQPDLPVKEIRTKLVEMVSRRYTAAA
ncbi:MAG: phosphoglycolate phosphatase [Candidatus Angelobacter sp.]|nr:phosphoglycolate phosphatase [Candidatus Angelobacter sp.]